MYDLHVHIIGHDNPPRDYSLSIDNYILQAELLNLEALGFVDHYPYRIRSVQKIKEKIEYYKRHAPFPVVYGAEVYLPSTVKIPKYFDYSLGHVRRGYTLEEAIKMTKIKNIDILAHPCAYGAQCAQHQSMALEHASIALELSEKALIYLPQWLYEKAHDVSIPLVLGSDAHTPRSMGFSHILERKLEWTPLHKIPFVEERGWL
jgi:histidinol phosphatase-like PHP family hydrolase